MIDDVKKAAIVAMLQSGLDSKSIAAVVDVSEKTIRSLKEKSPGLLEQVTEEEQKTISSTSDYTTNNSGLSSGKKKKGRHFLAVVYPSEKYYKEHNYSRYDGSDGWGSAPDDWVEQLKATGLPFVVSPLHDQDKHSDGTFKKPHWHVIVSWENTTTYDHANNVMQTITKCPSVRVSLSLRGSYRYLRHEEDPDKHQYLDEENKKYNGWTMPIDAESAFFLQNEIRKMIYINDCDEIGILESYCAQKGEEYSDFVSNHTFRFDKLCTSYRNARLKTLKVIYNEFVDNPEEQAIIGSLIKQYGDEADESKD